MMRKKKVDVDGSAAGRKLKLAYPVKYVMVNLARSGFLVRSFWLLRRQKKGGRGKEENKRKEGAWREWRDTHTTFSVMNNNFLVSCWFL